MNKEEAIKAVLTEVERQHRLILSDQEISAVNVTINDTICAAVITRSGSVFYIHTKVLAVGAL